jgi:hypothetical protein
VKKASLVLLILFCLSFVPFRGVTAQTTTPSLAIFELDLRPEFDQPGVLVVYHIVLASDTRLPATLTIRIPHRVGDPSQVAWVDPSDSSMTKMPYESVIKDGWNEVTFTTSAYEVDFEYHDPSITVNTDKRSFVYDWNGDFAIANLSIYIQQPVGASDMVISPNLGSAQKGDNNIVYYYSRLGQVDKGTSFSINLSYSKPNDDLSVEQLQVKPSVALSENTPGRTSLSELMPWLIGVLALLLVLGIAWWIWLIRQSQVPDTKKQESKPRRKRKKSDEPVYCPKCGHRAEGADVFCRVCGSKLRRDE